MCGYALNIAGIGRVIYGAGNDKFGGNNAEFDTSKMSPHFYESRGGLYKNEAVELLAKFYLRGNQNIPEEQRHRYKKQTLAEENSG
jgi:tRNA-specific adenosine deaminase 2